MKLYSLNTLIFSLLENERKLGPLWHLGAHTCCIFFTCQVCVCVRARVCLRMSVCIYAEFQFRWYKSIIRHPSCSERSLFAKGLFTLWTMKLSLDSLQFCDWLLNLSQDHLSLHQGKNNTRVSMEHEVPKRLIVRHILSAITVQLVLWWEMQKRFSCCKSHGNMEEKCHFLNLFLPNVIVVR